MNLPPIRRQVVVPAGLDLAFATFTDEIGRWWPVGAGHSVYGAGSAVAFRDGQLVESGPGGAVAVWGSVLDWDPPRRVRLTWHPGSGPEKATEVEFTFAPVGETQTLVTVEHRGWERYADPAGARSEYNQGWPFVLGHYVSSVAASPGGDGPVWLALLHTAGPSVGPAGVFGHPDFREHVAFLQRLSARGVLVAAGPFAGPGEGMTVLRLPSASDVAEYVRLAQEDDQSVVRGVLIVDIRPWQVMFTGASS